MTESNRIEEIKEHAHLLPRYLGLGATSAAIVLCLYQYGRTQGGLSVREIQYHTGIPKPSISAALASLYKRNFLLKYWSCSDESASCRVYLANFNAIHKVEFSVDRILTESNKGTPDVQVLKHRSGGVPDENDTEWRKGNRPVPRSMDIKKLEQGAVR